tara:strand:- start:21 stop:167 length:147 start_codon:yes stop_codon:yes gene_type:complete
MKLSPKQKKIAAAAEPRDKIDSKDFAALRQAPKKKMMKKKSIMGMARG